LVAAEGRLKTDWGLNMGAPPGIDAC